MSKPQPESQPEENSQAVQPQPAPEQSQPAGPKPDKNVAVPEYDLLTEGYDPAKLKKR